MLKPVLAFFALPVFLSACSSGTDISISSETYLHQGDTLRYAGGGCQHLKLPAKGGTTPGRRIGDFNMQESPDGDDFLVQVFSDDELLTSRRYDEAMLRSGKIDEFSITTHLGSVYTLRYWGGPCTNPPNDLDASPL